MHRKLDSALDQFFTRSQRILIPSDLSLKIEVAAMYILCGNTRDELVAALKPESPHVATEAMYVWLREAMGILELKMRPRGYHSIVKGL
jgi:hypothetical protein